MLLLAIKIHVYIYMSCSNTVYILVSQTRHEWSILWRSLIHFIQKCPASQQTSRYCMVQIWPINYKLIHRLWAISVLLYDIKLALNVLPFAGHIQFVTGPRTMSSQALIITGSQP